MMKNKHNLKKFLMDFQLHLIELKNNFYIHMRIMEKKTSGLFNSFLVKYEFARGVLAKSKKRYFNGYLQNLHFMLV